ncbi:putative acylesterase/phospholipase RssA [Methylobacterium sp. BE186]|uniref:patatin-like phospholipase family protein n=1 Tax=Methylobacterium sp. BE186 TaxID=2817715 RepID=UPI0028593EB8|nr:patatin-like phospholipase family protein [Methylobacterium sp. BE186]MDR7035657.1 putative acylesterase/phospholipase RssA [Methylobacterium sp. BE186]
MSGLTKRHLLLCTALAMLGTSAPGMALAAPSSKSPSPQASAPAGGRGSDQRATFTPGEAAAARPAALAAPVRIAGDDVSAFQGLIDGASEAREPWLVLSGGGENGAFAAGLLSGWSAAGDRPAFGVITGVSTGALIAPFAFIGAAGDRPLETAYTTVTAADVFEFGGTNEALTDTWPLKRRIARTVTPELLKAVASEHAKGRRLLVATTEVDTERPVLWDMGAIASAGGPKALELFRAIVLASSAVPGIFPPVMIDALAPDGKAFQEMHADGGTTAPFYLAPAAAITGAAPVRIPARTVYVVVNNKLAPDFQIASRTTLSVLGRSLSAAIKAQTRAALALTRNFAAANGLDVQVAEIDGRFGQTSAAPFDQGYMKALYAHGERLGRAGTAFATPDALARRDEPEAAGAALATGSVRPAPRPPGGRAQAASSDLARR